MEETIRVPLTNKEIGILLLLCDKKMSIQIDGEELISDLLKERLEDGVLEYSNSQARIAREDR